MGIFRTFGLLVGIACLVWVGVLWHWQATHRDMSSEDILVYLVALPLTAFALVLAARWAWRGASARVAASGAAPTATPASTAPAGASPTGASAERTLCFALLGAHVRCAAGDGIDDLMAAAEQGKPRPALDPELRDAEGLPVTTARVGALTTEPVDSALEALLSTSGDGPRPSDALRRALALLRPALMEAVDTLGRWPDRFAPAIDGGGTGHVAVPHRVRVLCAWPEGLAARERELAQAWIARELAQAGEGVVAAQAWQWQPSSATTGPQLWLEAEHLLVRLHQERLDDLVLVAACHSDIDARAVRRLDDDQRLFSSRRPKGTVPGEAAAVLLLANTGWPAVDTAAPAAPHLHRAAVAQRDKPIDAPGRQDSRLAAELLRQSLDAAGVAPEGAAGLASDADQHSARGAEMYGALLTRFPELDAGEDQRMVGQLCGRLGAVGTLLATALAARAAVHAKRPWVALSVADPQWRLALVARPEAPSPEPSQAAAVAADTTTA